MPFTTPAPGPVLEQPSRVSVVRQVAIILALWCGVVMVGLLAAWLLHPPGETSAERYVPANKKTALNLLFGAIRAVDGIAPAPLDAKAWAALLPVCVQNPPHGLRGQSVFDALVEQAAALDLRLERLSLAGTVDADGTPTSAPLAKRYRLDPAAWAAQVQAQGQRCQHALQALRQLGSSPRGAPLLADGLWTERARRAPKRATPDPVVVSMAPGALSQEDPWRGWPGCIWLSAAQPDGSAYYLGSPGRTDLGAQLCTQPGALPAGVRQAVAAAPARAGSLPPANSPAWSVPHDLGQLLAPLDRLRLPSGSLFTNYAAALPPDGTQRSLGRNSVTVGLNLQLTLDPRAQSAAQQLADCYTGRLEACALAGVAPAQVGAAQNGPGAGQMWENAAARMTGVVVIDVASGRIEALASAHTPCYAQEHRGMARDPSCAPLWTVPQRRPEALLNHAVYTDYMPGSTVKPILASVFFEDPAVNPGDLALWLAHSATDEFNQLMFCARGMKSRNAACDRPLRVQQRAAALGWNADCGVAPLLHCDQVDLLFGRRLSQRLADDQADDQPSARLPSAAPIQQRALAGRLFVEPAGQPANSQRLMPLPTQFGAVKTTCGGKHKAQTDACALGAPVALVNESDGQGQARATALGAATMLSRLAAAAQDLTAVRRPYLVEQVSDARGRPVAVAALRSDPAGADALARPEPLGVSPTVAKLTLKALGGGVRVGGTGHLICEHVFGKQCAAMGLNIAGKTGTPSFGLDKTTLSAARSLCGAKPEPSECALKPVKWYVAAYSSRNAGAKPFDKVIAVISERNWYLPGRSVAANWRDRLHGVNDLNNISTELAMRVVARQWQTPLPGQTPAGSAAAAARP